MLWACQKDIKDGDEQIRRKNLFYKNVLHCVDVVNTLDYTIDIGKEARR